MGGCGGPGQGKKRLTRCVGLLESGGAAKGTVVPDEQATQRLAEILGRIRKLGSANLEPPQFFANYLQLTVAATGSRGGALWLLQGGQGPQLYCHVDLELCGINESDGQKRLGAEAVGRTGKEGRPLVVPPEGPETAGTGGEGAAGNQCGRALFFYPLRAANQVAMVLQLIAAEGLSPQDYRAVVGLAGEAAEAAETYLSHRRAAVLEDDRKALAKLLQFAEGVHGTLDAEKVAYQVANLGRETIGCARVVVWLDPALKRGVRAVSGVDKPDRRAVLMQAVEKLGRHCLKINKPIVASREQLAELPVDEELTELLKDYFNVSQFNQVFLQPMAAGDRAVGVLVAEGFDEASGTNLAGVIATVAKQGGLALGNAVAAGQGTWSQPLARWRQAARGSRARRKWLAVAAVVLAGLAGLALVPWTIEVSADCRLRPRVKRVVDAPLDGVEIVKVLRSSGQVQAGEVVVQLNDADLQAERAAREAERAQAQVKFNQALGGSDEQYYRKELERLDARIALAKLQIDKCAIKAPITGRILTAQLELRAGETVKLGEPIFEMADLNEWELVLEVPQEEVGWVQRGLAERQKAAVRFFLQAYPERKLRAEITRPDQIGHLAQIAKGGNYFEVQVPVAEDELAPILAGLGDGSTGAAKIATAERALGYVLLRKVIRFFRVAFF